MKNFRIFILTLLLSTGFLLPSCEKNRDSCHGVDFEAAQYFDIQGMNAFMYEASLGLDLIRAADTVVFSERVGLHLTYIVDYHAFVEPVKSTPFSLINTASACSVLAGYEGSKTEKLVNLSIITLNDFDSLHLANSSINDLLDYDGTFYQEDKLPLADFLGEQTENIMYEALFLQLQKAPELNREFRYKVMVELSTGEMYEAESSPVYFKG